LLDQHREMLVEVQDDIDELGQEFHAAGRGLKEAAL
jgi:hypothetical protein